MTASQKRIIQNLANQVASTKVTNLERELLGFNSMLSNSLGFYETIVTNPLTGAKILYMHNLPQLEESMIIYKQASDGFGYTSNGWNDGNPTFETGVGADGTIVGNVLSTVGINAEWIKAGTIDAQIVKIKNIEIGGDTVYASGYDPSKIVIGGRNLFSANQYVSQRNSEGTANGNMYSVGSSGALVVDGVDQSSDYNTMRVADLKANTEYIFTFNIPINDRFSFYNIDGVAVSVAKDWSSDNTQLTFKMGNVDGYVGGKFYPIEQTYPVDIYLMVEKGNKSTDWTPAPEDIDAEFAKIRTNIKTDENGDLLINRENSPTFMKLDPDQLSFISNENKLPLASFGTKEMLITNAHVKQYLRIGSFEFVPSSDVNGDLTLKYIG